LRVAPVRLSERAAFRHATGSGQAAQEIELQGKAALEIAALWLWICQQVAMLPCNGASIKTKVTA